MPVTGFVRIYRLSRWIISRMFGGNSGIPGRNWLWGVPVALLVLVSPVTAFQSRGPAQSAGVGKYIIITAAGRNLPAVVSENPSTGFKQEITGGFVMLGDDGACVASTDYRYTENGRTQTSTSKSEGRYEIAGEAIILIFGSDRLRGTLRGDRADVELTLQRVEYAAGPKLVSFPTDDGGLVHADLYGTGERGVVLAHGGRFDKESWRDQAVELVRAGFRVLSIDFRGYGRSRGGGKLAPSDDGYRYDVLAAVRYLRGQGARTVSIVGGSMGGTAAAEASTEAAPGEIDRIVMIAHGRIANPEKMQGRKLFITAREDLNARDIPRLVAIREQFEKAPEPKRLVVLEGSAHAQYIFQTDQGPRLLKEIIRFLSEVVR